MLLGVAWLPAVWADPPTQPDADSQAGKAAKQSDSASKNWKPLVGSWSECVFGGDGSIEIKDSGIVVKIGDPMTGVCWKGDVFRENYEVELEARRNDGSDFFCGLTFPVGKDHVSLVLGGWGGGTVGISSVDGFDASENETTSYRNFEEGKWYKVRVRVEPNEIRCWIDDKPAAEQQRHGHKFDIRYEMDPTIPLGLAAYLCDAEYRNLRIRKLTDKEISGAKKKPADEGDGS